MDLFNTKIAVVGLGYVGLPLAVEFSRKFDVIGFDINNKRIEELKAGIDKTNEIDTEDISLVKSLCYSSKPDDIVKCNVYIITVPTPVDKNKQPDLVPLLGATRIIGKILKKNDVVIYESTVYPGATENDCVPILESESGLKLNLDFYVGYSPERVSPGDNLRRLTTIVKVTSGSNPESAEFINNLYKEIVPAGTYMAESIKIAEASKVIENTQRDLNIALINELAMIFNKMNIDTDAVLRAAGTKWNFLNFRPGLVGGHCIGVDPYYLTHIAESIGYYPEIILAGRRVNDRMGSHIVSQLIRAMTKKDIKVNRAKIIILGMSFKENCPDIRNTRVVDLYHSLREYTCDVDVYDPWVSKEEALREHKVSILDSLPSEGTYDAIVIAVAHKQFVQMGVEEIRRVGKKNHILYDLKHLFSSAESDLRL